MSKATEIISWIFPLHNGRHHSSAEPLSALKIAMIDLAIPSSLLHEGLILDGTPDFQAAVIHISVPDAAPWSSPATYRMAAI